MTNLADRLRAHATGFVHAHATERLLIEAAEALTPSPDHADLIGRLEERREAWVEVVGADRLVKMVPDELCTEAAAAIRALEADRNRWRDQFDARALDIIKLGQEVGALTAALSRAEGENAWQPIETAPRDETWIELWWPDTEAKVHAGFWSNTGPNDWYRSEADSHPMRDYFDGQPTHWRAIREPLGLSRADDASGNEGEGQ